MNSEISRAFVCEHRLEGMERVKYSRGLKSAPSSETLHLHVSSTKNTRRAHGCPLDHWQAAAASLGTCRCVSLLKQICVTGLGSLFASPLLEPQLQSMTILTLGKAGEVEGQTDSWVCVYQTQGMYLPPCRHPFLSGL